MNRTYHRLLHEILTLPTSPLHEEHVVNYIREWAAQHPAVRVRADEFGNLHLILKRRAIRSRRPLVLCAHMDHPGFEAVRMEDPRTLRAKWCNGVSKAYFHNAGVRFFVDDRWIRGRIRSVELHTEVRLRGRVKTVRVRVDQPVPRGAIGMWDLPDPAVRNGRIYARGCDDVAGVAAIMCAFDQLCRSNKPVNCIGLCTRGEELGWAGAIAAAQHQLIPRNARIISIECSSQLPGVQMGGGPILRVGDRTAIFTPPLTSWCQSVAEDLIRADRRFRFQRKLMDAGMCEASAFCAFGYEATGLCIALGNYHNMDTRHVRVGPEYVDLHDFDGLVRWFIALATTRRTEPEPKLARIIDRWSRRYLPALRNSTRLGGVAGRGRTGNVELIMV